MLKALIKEEDVVKKFEQNDFIVGYTTIVHNPMKDHVVHVMCGQTNTIVLISSACGYIDNVTFVTGQSKNRIDVYTSSPKTFWEKINREIRTYGDRPAAVYVFENILFRSYDPDEVKAKQFISAFSEFSPELQKVFQQDFDGLQLKNLPSKVYHRYDFFRDSSRNRLVYVTDRCGNSYCLKEFDEIFAGTERLEIRSLSSGRYVNVSASTVIAEYAPYVKMVLSAMGPLFDPEVARTRFGKTLPPSRITDMSAEAYSGRESRTSCNAYLCTPYKDRYFCLGCKCGLVIAGISTPDEFGAFVPVTSTEVIMDLFRNSSEYISMAIGEVIGYFQPILAGMDMLDYLVEVADIYANNEDPACL